MPSCIPMRKPNNKPIQSSSYPKDFTEILSEVNEVFNSKLSPNKSTWPSFSGSRTLESLRLGTLLLAIASVFRRLLSRWLCSAALYTLLWSSCNFFVRAVSLLSRWNSSRIEFLGSFLGHKDPLMWYQLLYWYTTLNGDVNVPLLGFAGMWPDITQSV